MAGGLVSVTYDYTRNHKLKSIICYSLVSHEVGVDLLQKCDRIIIKSAEGSINRHLFGYLFQVDGHWIYFETKKIVNTQFVQEIQVDSLELPW